MKKERMEAFSDGVFAVVITIMVLDLKTPTGVHLQALASVLPIFASYVLSFIYVGIYWNNHHHLLHAADHVDGTVLWANLHLLFWLSLAPFATAWMGASHYASLPVALYGGMLLLAAVAYFLLTRALIARHPVDSPLSRAIGSDTKGSMSIVIYLVSIGLAFLEPPLACLGYGIVAAMWLLPDRRIERSIVQTQEAQQSRSKGRSFL